MPRGRLARLAAPLVDRLFLFRVPERKLLTCARRQPLPASKRADAPLDVVLYMGHLNSGGAERQHVNLAAGLMQRGHSVRVLTSNPLQGEDSHYAARLERLRIPVSQAGGPGALASRERLGRDVNRLLRSVTPEIRGPIWALASQLMLRTPDLLHATLDYTNVVGGAAALLAGVPHILLSTRNVNPSHFSFYRPWMDHWYRFLGTLPQVHFIANSRVGAEDYSRWTGIPLSRFTVILNGVDLAGLPEPAPGQVAAVRAELGAQTGDPVVAGIFRLSWEKQPLLFLDVVAKVARAMPGLKVALVGVGADRERVERGIVARRIESIVSMLGQRRDIPAILSAADLLLLTSAHEGTPNVALEAQWFGCPPVLTAAGGSPETVEPGVTGFLHAIDDADGLAGSVMRLLTDHGLKARMAEAGRRRIRDHFSIERTLEKTLAVYRAAQGSAPSGAAPVEARRVV